MSSHPSREVAQAARPESSPTCGSGSPPPAPMGGSVSVRELLRVLNAMQERMAAMGAWIDEPPDAATYASLGDFRRQAYSLQFALAAMDEKLRRAADFGPRAAAEAAAGLASALATLVDTLRGTPEGNALAEASQRLLRGMRPGPA